MKLNLKSIFVKRIKLKQNQLPKLFIFSTTLFHSELTSGSWTAIRPHALQWGSGLSGPGSLSSTHACSLQCRTRRGAGRSLRPPPPLESEGPRSGTSQAAAERDERVKKQDDRGKGVWECNLDNKSKPETTRGKNRKQKISGNKLLSTITP